ncbi:MAG: hypothetical protein AAGI38_17515, partial [Bacteroidota bacterium]
MKHNLQCSSNRTGMQHLRMSWILLTLFLVASTQKADAQFQNPRWIIPQYHYDFLSTPPANPVKLLPHPGASLPIDATPFNSISDPCTNELEFYVMGSSLYYKKSSGFFEKDFFNSLNDEDGAIVAIVPKPGSTDYYYVIYPVLVNINTSQIRYIEYDAVNNQVIIPSNPTHPSLFAFNTFGIPTNSFGPGISTFDVSFPD